MTPGVYNLTLYRGDTYSWKFRLWQDTGMTVPVDLTGATVAAEIREKSAGVVIVALVCAVTMPNTIDAYLSADDCAACPTNGVWDLQVTFPADEVRTVVKGAVKVEGDVTDSLVAPAGRSRST